MLGIPGAGEDYQGHRGRRREPGVSLGFESRSLLAHFMTARSVVDARSGDVSRAIYIDGRRPRVRARESHSQVASITARFRLD